MKVKEIKEALKIKVINEGDHMDEDISCPACCDLLSVAMGTLPESCAWVTVMANINTLAVASLTDAACVILAHNTAYTEEFAEKAKAEGITVFGCQEAVFDAALAIQRVLDRA